MWYITFFRTICITKLLFLFSTEIDKENIIYLMRLKVENKNAMKKKCILFIFDFIEKKNSY